MAGKQSVKIDPLLEPLLAPTRDEEIDQYISQLIATHVGPVTKGVVRHKLHLNSHRGIEQKDLFETRRQQTGRFSNLYEHRNACRLSS
jgi:hypothetical protein